ncbi:hypothetical protein BOX15_Mlig012256g1, partial [Macrostomum lignano]
DDSAGSSCPGRHAALLYRPVRQPALSLTRLRLGDRPLLRRPEHRWPSSLAPIPKRLCSLAAPQSLIISLLKALPGSTSQGSVTSLLARLSTSACSTRRALESEGFEVTYLPVKPSGLLDLASLESAIRPDTALVSVMTVNNEIGVRQPVEKIGALCRSRGVFFHTDAAQAVGKMPIDVNAACIDLMSISGHKLYGPKGVGAIYVRRRPRVRLEPLQSGGGQERGMRSGTVPSFLAVGLGAACQLAGQEMAFDAERVDRLSQRLIDRIVSQLSHVWLTATGQLLSRLR